jgi:hypothetical protein
MGVELDALAARDGVGGFAPLGRGAATSVGKELPSPSGKGVFEKPSPFGGATGRARVSLAWRLPDEVARHGASIRFQRRIASGLIAEPRWGGV